MPKKSRKASQPTRKFVLLNKFQAPSIYANHAGMGMTPWEITLTLHEVMEASDDGLTVRELGRVIMSPPFAKILHGLLGKTLEQYEVEYRSGATKTDSGKSKPSSA